MDKKKKKEHGQRKQLLKFFESKNAQGYKKKTAFFSKGQIKFCKHKHPINNA